MNDFNSEFPGVVAAATENDFPPKNVLLLFLSDLEKKVLHTKQFLTCEKKLATVEEVMEASQNLRDILLREYSTVSELLSNIDTQQCIKELHGACEVV